jgi:3-hydroxyacyl-CoA dehydrogenase
VSAQTNHKVTLVDVNSEVLEQARGRIHQSINRVAKKMFKEDNKVKTIKQFFITFGQMGFIRVT